MLYIGEQSWDLMPTVLECSKSITHWLGGGTALLWKVSLSCKLSLLGLTPVSAYGWMENKAGRFITERPCWFSVTHYTLSLCQLYHSASNVAWHYKCTLLSSQLWVVWLRGTSPNRDHYLLWIPGWWNRKLICIWRSWIIVLFHLPSMCCYSNRSAALQEHEVFSETLKGEGVQLHSFKC